MIVDFGYRLHNVKYFEWLKSLVGARENEPFEKYSNLLELLHLIPYIPNNDYDISRYEDGMLLRHYYGADSEDYIDYTSKVSEEHYHSRFYQETMHINCTCLELFIALAKKIDDRYLNNQTDRTYIWFWMMLDNMGLLRYTSDILSDTNWPTEAQDDVIRILKDFMAFTIDENGHLYPFPFIIDGYYYSLYDALNKWISDNFDALYSLDPQNYIEKLKGEYQI